MLRYVAFKVKQKQISSIALQLYLSGFSLVLEANEFIEVVLLVQKQVRSL